MKLKFTRKTWYFFLLAGCGASMLNAMAVLTGTEWAFLEMVSFCIIAMATLFLAAERDNAPKDKGRYFLVFVLLMLSYLINGWAGYLGAALAWPVLLAVERGRGAPVSRPLQLVGAAELAHLVFLLLGNAGFEGMKFWANLFWLLLPIARGYGALVLYRTGEGD